MESIPLTGYGPSDFPALLKISGKDFPIFSYHQAVLKFEHGMVPGSIAPRIFTSSLAGWYVSIFLLFTHSELLSKNLWTAGEAEGSRRQNTASAAFSWEHNGSIISYFILGLEPSQPYFENKPARVHQAVHCKS